MDRHDCIAIRKLNGLLKAGLVASHEVARWADLKKPFIEYDAFSYLLTGNESSNQALTENVEEFEERVCRLVKSITKDDLSHNLLCNKSDLLDYFMISSNCFVKGYMRMQNNYGLELGEYVILSCFSDCINSNISSFNTADLRMCYTILDNAYRISCNSMHTYLNGGITENVINYICNHDVDRNYVYQNMPASLRLIVEKIS